MGKSPTARFSRKFNILTVYSSELNAKAYGSLRHFKKGQVPICKTRGSRVRLWPFVLLSFPNLQPWSECCIQGQLHEIVTHVSLQYTYHWFCRSSSRPKRGNVFLGHLSCRCIAPNAYQFCCTCLRSSPWQYICRSLTFCWP